MEADQHEKSGISSVVRCMEINYDDLSFSAYFKEIICTVYTKVCMMLRRKDIPQIG